MIEFIAWWRFTHPELFAGWVGLWFILGVDLMVLAVLEVSEAIRSASACKINKWR